MFILSHKNLKTLLGIETDTCARRLLASQKVHKNPKTLLGIETDDHYSKLYRTQMSEKFD